MQSSCNAESRPEWPRHALSLQTITHSSRKLLSDSSEPECEVVGTVADGRALLRLAPQVSPDLVLVDLNMPLLNSLDASEQLKQALPKSRVVC